jgi:uncharacterized protein (DUF1800 family)
MSARDAAVALRRFGLGPRPGEVQRIAADPRGFLLQSLTTPDAARIAAESLAPSHLVLANVMEARLNRRLERQAAKEMKGAQEAAPEAGVAAAEPKSPHASRPGSPSDKSAAAPDKAKPGQIRRQAFLEEAAARFAHAAGTDAGFLERLVMFWSNHFCVSAGKGPVRAIAGAYEREVIRPHVLGRFADMLTAAEQHPAMLIYLDNHLSTGPNSKAGRARERGLNENLAREILELHTLGVEGGYTENDVGNLARILTGWTIGRPNQPNAEPGKFFFAPARHEPGAFTVLGQSYGDQGRLGGEQVLSRLARHPATARHIARKLCRHFIAEEVPPALVERLEATFRDTDGDLAALARALITSPEAWQGPPRKVLPPYDFLIALLRGLAIGPKPGELLRLTKVLGQPLWEPPAPQGWPDDDAAWAGPAPIRERVRVAELAARQVDPLADPRAVAEDLLGESMSAATRQAIARAETREQGFELLIMSPEFQRR